MRLTLSQLKTIIKEEVTRAMNEVTDTTLEDPKLEKMGLTVDEIKGFKFTSLLVDRTAPLRKNLNATHPELAEELADLDVKQLIIKLYDGHLDLMQKIDGDW